MNHSGLSRLDDLDADFKAQVEAVLADLRTKGVPVCVVSGRRTMQQQKQIYDQGRTLPGKIVSNAPPGSSAHNFGMAVDLAPLDAKGDINWNDNAGFKMIADCAVSHGLVSGANFKSFVDKPHVESPHWREQQALWKSGKLEVA